MPDFDFEELDKAVSGAMGGTESPTREEVTSRENSTTSIPAREVPPAARRSSGRFMDMVHPTSDMRSQRPVSQSATPESVPTPAITPAHESSSTPAPQPFFAENDLSTPAQPLESPFLPDAKVEKRPLGGYGESALSSTNTLELLDEPHDTPAPSEVHTMPDPIDFAETSTLETQPVEPTSAEPTEDVELIPAEPIEPESTLQSNENEDKGLSSSEALAPDLSAIENAPVGPTSITQQYEEKPSEAPQPGAIFDTEAYHQPFAVQPKKKSSALIILWIVVLVVLGAAAGAAFYMFVLPLL